MLLVNEGINTTLSSEEIRDVGAGGARPSGNAHSRRQLPRQGGKWEAAGGSR